MTLLQPDQKRLRIFEAIFAIFLFLIGIWFVLPPWQLPGDLGDTRFNLYVLEHGYRWLVGLEPSFWNAPFFYPAENTLAYSDSHLGSFLIYAVFRLLNFDTYDALYGWLLVCTTANYASAFWVSRQLKISYLGALVAAFIFTFGLPVSGQIGHVQIVARFWVPIAFLLVYRLMTGGNIKSIYLLVFVIVAQLYASIYTGYFLLLCLIGFILYFLVDSERDALTKLFSPLGGIHLASAATLGVLLLFPLAVPHYIASQAVGGRDWAEIATMLPQPLSYFRAPQSELWKRILPSTESLPMAHEHILFFGLVPLLSMVLFTLLRNPKIWAWQLRRVGLAMLASFLVVFVITLNFNGVSFYQIIAGFPGVSGIRAVTRVGTVLVFPVSIISGIVISQALDWTKNRLAAPYSLLLIALLLGALILDQRPSVPGFTKSDALLLSEPLEEQLVNNEEPVIWLGNSDANNNAFWETNLTAMLLSQKLNKSTINGYSGSIPPGYPGELFTHKSENMCEALQQWLINSGEPISFDKIVQLESPHCDFSGDKIYLSKDFYGWEKAPNTPRWAWASASSADLFIRNGSSRYERFRLNFDVGVIAAGSIRIITPDSELSFSVKPGVSVFVETVLPPFAGLYKIKIITDIVPQLPGNGDPRKMTFNISSLELVSVAPRN